MAFAKDFKPDVWIVGGDGLDCGEISHHNKGKPGRVEGLRLARAAEEMRQEVIEPIEKLAEKRVYIIGNHEDWIQDLLDEAPALVGLVDVPSLLHLDNWTVVEQGGSFQLGKLFFIHGDQISGGVNAAKNAVEGYMENVRLGHFHTYQVSTKTSAVEHALARTGIVVPCLCKKNPKYNESRPNRWVQGFLYGYVQPNGNFSDYVAVIINGKVAVNGKVYEG